MMPHTFRTRYALAWLVAALLSACGGGGGSDTTHPQATLEVKTTGNGKLFSASPALDCGTQCRARVAAGTIVVLTAVASDGYAVRGWTTQLVEPAPPSVALVPCRGTGQLCPLTVAADTIVTAHFAPAVTVTVNTVGQGSVIAHELGIEGLCTVQCSATVGQGATVNVRAVPAAGQVFSGWSGACSGSGDTCTLTANPTVAALAVTATFAPAAQP